MLGGKLHRWVKSRNIRTARKAYADAKAKLDDAKARRDTRDEHDAAKLLGDAMTELLKAETVRVVRR